jgi:predicted phage replisome organizer
MSESRYYWLKLKRDFFKRHDIRIVEDVPNGKDYLLFYLKLLLESIDHDGQLRFNESIPYNEKMLSTITNTNIDIVRSAVQLFIELQMMQLLDDGTLYMTEVQKMLGSASNTEGAERVRRFREKQKQAALQSVTEIVTKCNESIEYRDKSIDIKEIPKGIKKSAGRFTPPSVDEVRDYIREKGFAVDAEAFCAFYDSNGWKVGRNPMKDWRRALVTWDKRRKTEQPTAQQPNQYKRFDDNF